MKQGNSNLNSVIEFTSFRKILNTALFDLRSKLGFRVNMIGMLVIVGSVILSMISTLDSLSEKTRTIIEWVELIVTIAFAIEYFLRLWAAKKPLAYALSFYGLVDLLTWLPLLLLGDANFALRLLRIIRLLKLLRYMRALQLMLSSLSDVLDIVTVVIAAIGIIVLIAGNLIHYLEPENFTNAFIGSWWALVTMTTVGYGDIVPSSIAGKLEAAALMVIGITLFALLTGTISVKIAHLLNKNKICSNCNKHIEEDYFYCPYCGRQQDEDAKPSPETQK